MPRAPREAKIEAYLKERVDDMDGVCVKLNPAGYKGIPDRLVVLKGRVMFVELKRPRGGRVSAIQRHWHDLLRGLGAEVHVCPTKASVDDALS